MDDFKQLYLSLDGRINRSTYWLRFILPMVVIGIVITILDAVLKTGEVLGIIWSLALIWPIIVIYAKRWHDRNKSGWWTLVGVIPIIGGFWILVELGFLGGTSGENRFGPEPD